MKKEININTHKLGVPHEYKEIGRQKFIDTVFEYLSEFIITRGGAVAISYNNTGDLISTSGLSNKELELIKIIKDSVESHVKDYVRILQFMNS